MKSPNPTQAYIDSLEDKTSGMFRFSRHAPPSPMASSYAILATETLGNINKRNFENTVDSLDHTLSSLTSLSQRIEQNLLPQTHSLEYFLEEETAFHLQALHALNSNPSNFDTSRIITDKSKLIDFFNSLSWDNPWRDSNRVMFALSNLCWLIDNQSRSDLVALLSSALDWIDDHQSPESGLWAPQKKVPLSNCMAATFHFSFFYLWIGREFKYTNKIIDSCLSLQENHGLFSGPYGIGQNCLDYDAIDLLAKCYQLCSHRKHEVEAALRKAKSQLKKLENSDGGFANNKKSRVLRIKARGLNRLQHKIIDSKRFPKADSIFLKEIDSTGDYNVCLKYLQCKNNESNVFCTWFRTLSINLCNTILATEEKTKSEVSFRSLPFLGYHPFTDKKVN